MPNLKFRNGAKFNPVKGVRAKLRGLTFSRLIPNVVTLCALCSGISSIRFALEGHYKIALLFILIAAVLDGVDGRLARFLGGESRFGAELDSLADFVNFGVSPALILYLYALKPFGSIGWGAVLIYVVCSALRLARFNVISIEEEQNPDKKLVPDGFFMGVPIPIAAFLVLMPLFLCVANHFPVNVHPYIMIGWMLIVSYLMVSRLFIFSFKKMYIPKRNILPIMITVGVIMAFLIEAPWFTLFAAGVFYICFIPMSHKRAQKMNTELTNNDISK